MKRVLIAMAAAAVFGAAANPVFAAPAAELRVLFLGDDGHHQPEERFEQLEPVLSRRGIDLAYTASLGDLNPAKLAGFDALAIYANHTRITPEQEKALLDFVAEGGGLVALHCASYCFLNSDAYIELVGGQFQRHGGEVFKETIVQPDHPIMEGLEPIESWDETYVHTRHNPDRIVLAERRDASGSEPYTWVREHGKGRVFYSAWGHDQRTWGHPSFQALVERGIRWASANSPAQLKPAENLPPLKYTEAPAPLPNYLANQRWGTQGDPITMMQEPLPPEQSMRHLAVFPEFEKTLFASEPDIVKPIWLSWDERGRLWIAETVDYPNKMQPPGQGRDRLKICEDTDGDGKADKFTVFADRLSVPTSFVFANGGVIVIHSGKTEFLRDTDGDDKADERKVLFTGWGTGDTHAGPSNLRYGFDGWIWGVVGYSGFRGTVGGEEIRFGQGIYRFKPDGSRLEFIRSSNNNTWGLGWSEDALLFGSTANGNASMYMPIPNRYYEAVNGWSASRLESIADSQRFYPLTDKVRQVDFHGRYTAGAGSAIYTARNFPRQYWNKAQFVTEPTGHLVGLFYLIRDGADFTAHNARNFAASTDEWSSPIAAEVGPDGALWVLDWYNYIIQHNPTPRGFETGEGNAYETPLRDKTHGRIYRIAWKDAHPVEMPRLSTEHPEELVATLNHDNFLWRMHAQRLLVERGKKDVIPALAKLVENTSTDEIGLNPGALHALWTLSGLGAIPAESTATRAAIDGLGHPSAAVRRSAVLVLPRNETGLAALLEGNLLQDADPQVRLAAFLALSEMPPSAEAGAAIYKALQEPANTEGRWIPDAAAAAAARHDSGFLLSTLASFKPVLEDPSAAVPSGNIIPNPSFEKADGERPEGWRIARYSGRADYEYAETGRTGERSVKITSERGADAGWATSVQVKPRTEYRLTAWIKTEDLESGSGQGAWLNIHELQDRERGATKPLAGNTPWTQVTLDFNTGNLSEITINCLFGGWGQSRGTAWYDDIELSPAPGALLAGEAGRVVRLVTTHYAERGPVDDIVSTLAALEGADLALVVPVLDGLVRGWPEGKSPRIGEAEKQRLTELMNSLPENARDRLLALSQKWGAELFGQNVAAIIKNLKEQISDSAAPDEKRAAAARRLVALSDTPEATTLVLGQVNPLTPPSLAGGLIAALTEGRGEHIGEALAAHWDRFSPAARRAAVTTALRRPEWTLSILKAVQEGEINRGDLAAEHWSQLRQSPNRRIARWAARLSEFKGRVSEDRQEIVAKLLPLANEKGDPLRGKEVFTVNCAVCHAFNGEGGAIGPDLNGVAARDRAEILLDIIAPNRSVEANYRLWNVTTKDGETYSGRLDAETQTTIEITDVAGQKHVIQRKDITSLQSSGLSLMPSGFEALPPEDLKAMLEYLSQPHS